MQLVCHSLLPSISLMDKQTLQLMFTTHVSLLYLITGKEQKAAADPACSRHIETLLAAAPPAQLISFLGSIMDTGGMFELAMR